MLPEAGDKNQSKTQGGKSKNPFFHNFFYLFPYKYLLAFYLRKTRVFQPNAQVRSTKRNICSRNVLKKVNHKLPITNDHLPVTNHHLPMTNYQLPFTNYHLPITIYQLPLTNYAKQTQFPKSRNEINLLFSKGL